MDWLLDDMDTTDENDSLDPEQDTSPILAETFGLDDLVNLPKLDHLKTTMEFLKPMKNAHLDNCGLNADTLNQLHNSVTEPLNFKDQGTLLGLDLFIALRNSAQETYNSI